MTKPVDKVRMVGDGGGGEGGGRRIGRRGKCTASLGGKGWYSQALRIVCVCVCVRVCVCGMLDSRDSSQEVEKGECMGRWTAGG